LAINGPKSVIAPTAKNIRQGNKLDFTPAYMTPITPASYQCSISLKYPNTPESGIFDKKIPKAIGRRSIGSNFFLIAR